MTADVRSRMVDGAIRLLATRGLAGTSFSEVLEATGAPRGSIYHHFPGGKDELIGAAVDRSAQNAVALLDQRAGEPADRVAELFLDAWRLLLTRSGFEAGCALVAVTVDADTEALRERAAEAFSVWRAHLAALLARGGLREDSARRTATLLLAAAEGGVILSRAARELEPFDTVAAALLVQVRAELTP
ncbi:TetR/AcrR family transcriptional regulator [Leifsonia sp. ZF2019]|uniref:TetR/AcrR family transcriptional regulator n=1 Tax=Leifsonia sp. ZF2019 TaxID=2781978 RepID=UPI001CBB28C9|nr:TetR/AcrR family transcriptional regulator [Leifsonia sp. ZF2019]UAJ79363.1 TetR/AcrR family transcriptional regulator [Leifsonia sp. ZF2019]